MMHKLSKFKDKEKNTVNFRKIIISSFLLELVKQMCNIICATLFLHKYEVKPISAAEKSNHV